jgi:hypothetical protein
MAPEYQILSERLLREIVDRKAKSGFKLTALQIKPPLAGATFGNSETGVNYHLLAEQAEKALYDETGTPEDPGTYIGVRASFQGWIFTFDEERAKVGWLAAESDDSLTVMCTSVGTSRATTLLASTQGGDRAMRWDSGTLS